MSIARIFLVEDESLVAAQISETLESRGYSVVGTAVSGESAVTQILEKKPDLVLMDIRIRGTMDGIETTKKLNAEHRFPIVYLTAFCDDELMGRARLTGPFGYLIKPYRDNELDATIKMAIHKAKMDAFMHSALREKEVLLREIHHRVKNNMQIISSLLHLQARQSDLEEVESYLEICKMRINSMSLIHEKLYQSKLLSQINTEKYLKDLVPELINGFGGIAQHQVKYDVRNVSIDINLAIPFGLLVSEIVTNALKYAFKDTESPELRIDLRLISVDKIELFIGDNGCGIPKDILSKPYQNSFGRRLVGLIVEEQMGGTVQLETSPGQGTQYRIQFPRHLPDEISH